MARPRLLVTRKLPDAVEARIRRDYDAVLNEDDRAYGPEDLVRLAQGMDGVLTCGTERWTPARDRGGCPTGCGSSPRSRSATSISISRRSPSAASSSPTPRTCSPRPPPTSPCSACSGAARRAWESQMLLRERRWDRPKMAELLGLDLRGRVLGIVGMGRIGQATARRARGFGMTIHYHNRRQLPDEKAQGAVYHETLDSLLPSLPLPVAQQPGRRGDASSHERTHARIASTRRGRS